MTVNATGNHPFSVWAKGSEKLTFITAWFAHTHVNFSENFAHVLNWWCSKWNEVALSSKDKSYKLSILISGNNSLRTLLWVMVLIGSFLTSFKRIIQFLV